MAPNTALLSSTLVLAGFLAIFLTSLRPALHLDPRVKIRSNVAPMQKIGRSQRRILRPMAKVDLRNLDSKPANDKFHIMEYWKRKPVEDIQEELRRLRINKEGLSDEDLLGIVVDEVARLTRKYSSRSRSSEETAKSRPPATFQWQDFVIKVPNDINRGLRKDRVYSASAFAPKQTFKKLQVEQRQQPETKSSSQTNVSSGPVLGNGMSPEELRRRVMGGGANDMENVLDRNGHKTNRGDQGFSSQRDWSKDGKQSDEAPGRFGHYSDSAFPTGTGTTSGPKYTEEGWLPSYVVGTPIKVTTIKFESEILKEKEKEQRRLESWSAKDGFVAEAQLVACPPEIPDDFHDLAACVIKMALRKNKPLEKEASFILDTGRKHNVRTLVASKKLFHGGHPFGDAAVTPASPDAIAPLLDDDSIDNLAQLPVDGILDSEFLSQYDLDIDFKKNTANFFEPGSLLRHNPSIEGGVLVDLPLEFAARPAIIKTFLRKDPRVTPEGLMQLHGDLEEAFAVVSTSHLKTVVSPDFAARFTKCIADDMEDVDQQVALGAMGGGGVGSQPNSCDAIYAQLEFSSESGEIQTERRRFAVMDRMDIETIKEFAKVTEEGRMPDMILGLDVLAGPKKSGRVSISWAHKRLRISVPNHPAEN